MFIEWRRPLELAALRVTKKFTCHVPFKCQLALLEDAWYWYGLVRVNSPAVCRAKRLQGDCIPFVNNQPAAHPPSDCCCRTVRCHKMSQRSPSLSPAIQVACSAHSSVAQPPQGITTSRMLNNWSNRPNTACTMKYITVTLYASHDLPV